MTVSFLATQTLNIITAATFLALAALGLYIVFNLMGVINLAHGDFMMLGAYFQLSLVAMGIDFWLAALFAALFTGLVGVLVERIVLRNLYAAGELTTLLATWGLGIVFQQGVRLVYGAQTKFLAIPLQGSLRLGSFQYPAYHLVITGVAWLVLGAVVLLLLKTRFGTAARATMDNRVAAEAVGVETPRILSATFGLGTGLIGLAGALLAPILGILPTMGLAYLAKSFFVVILGGTASVLNALGGAAVIAGSENVLRILSNGTVAQIALLLMVITILYIRPHGLFGRGGRPGA